MRSLYLFFSEISKPAQGMTGNSDKTALYLLQAAAEKAKEKQSGSTNYHYFYSYLYPQFDPFYSAKLPPEELPETSK